MADETGRHDADPEPMSDRDAFRAEPGDDLKTPDEWCKLLGYEVLDPDGWRGSGGRPWTDPISRAEFEQRLVVCTQRRVPVDERAEFRERRDHGLKARHETRRELGKAEAWEQIADEVSLGEDWQVEDPRISYVDVQIDKEGYLRLEEIRAARSLPSGATSDATSGVPGHQEVSEAARSPQEPGEDPDCPVPLMHSHRGRFVTRIPNEDPCEEATE